MTGDNHLRSAEPPEVWSRGISDNQQAERKRVKKERKIRLRAQTIMTMATQKKKQKETNKAQS